VSSASSSSVWQIHLLGGLRLVQGPQTITRFRSQKFGALLAYLALFPNRLHSREELADLLWPDADPDAARVNLRSALSSLRRQLEPPGSPAGCILVADGRTHLHLNRDLVQVDAWEFDSALNLASRTTGDTAAEHLSRAVSLYTGPLLPGYYESWALTERDRLAEAHLQALHQLAALMERSGHADQALHYARLAVSQDPLREESHGVVIRLLMQSGQAAAARRQYEELARLLKEEYDGQPEPRTRELLSLKSVPPASAPVPSIPVAPPPPPASPRTPAPEPAAAVSVTADAEAVPQNFPLTLTRFFGREGEVEALRAQLGSEETRLVTITGPGGSGKTRFSTETARALGAEFRGGIFFVPLADVQEADLLPAALAAVLGIARGGAPNIPLLTQVEAALRTASERGGRSSFWITSSI
jgi:DNA-binding SARP family transcriptional activator